MIIKKDESRAEMQWYSIPEEVNAIPRGHATHLTSEAKAMRRRDGVQNVARADLGEQEEDDGGHAPRGEEDAASMVPMNGASS